MNTVKIRDIEIGAGAPKIIVPIVGITKEDIAEVVTHAAFYCGWPKAWAVFRMAKDIWGEE